MVMCKCEWKREREREREREKGQVDMLVIHLRTLDQRGNNYPTIKWVVQLADISSQYSQILSIITR